MIRTAANRVRSILAGLRRSGPAGPAPATATAPMPTPRAPSGARRRGPVPKRREGVLGIEIARGGLRFVELGRAGGHPVLRNFGEIAFGSTEDLTGVFDMLVEEYGVRAKDVHVVDSTGRANLKVRRMPDMPDADLGAIMAGEILAEAELLGEALVGDWCRLRKVGPEVEILVGKLPVADRTGLARACRDSGLRLQALTSSSVVLARHLLATSEVPEGETIGLLDIGRSKTNMALISSDHVRLVREVYQGVTASFLKNESRSGEELDLDAIGAGLDEVVGTVQQIRRTWQQYQSQNPESSLHHLVMTGETTRISRLIGLLQHDLRVPVRTWDPTGGSETARLPEEFVRLASTYAVPWVLATTPAPLIDLNFAEGVPDLRPVRVLQAVAAAAALGILAGGAVRLVEGNRLENDREDYARTEDRRAELQVELGLLEEVQVLWNGWLDGETARSEVPPVDFRPHLAEIARALPEELRLTRVVFDKRGSTWQVEAFAIATRGSARESHLVMERFVNAVAESPLITDVSMHPLSYEDSRDGKSRNVLEFTLVGRVREASRPDPTATGEPEVAS